MNPQWRSKLTSKELNPSKVPFGYMAMQGLEELFTRLSTLGSRIAAVAPLGLIVLALPINVKQVRRTCKSVQAVG
jgi:hypothetical protein